MTATPLVSVLVPAWNVAETIERSLESVLELTDASLECIVVDDASTDGTADVVAAMASRDDRIQLIVLAENGGVSNARNRGLEAVRGTWLTLLDADDRFLADGLGTLVRAARDSDALAVIGQQIWWDGRRHWLSGAYDVPDIRLAGRKSLVANPGVLHYVSPHAKLLHRDCWQDLRFSGRVLGDQPWIIRALIRAGDRIDVLDETVYEWFRPPASAGYSSITSTTRSSVARGVEAIGVATGALAQVRAEAEARLAPEDAASLLRHYAARLIGIDLGAHIGTALERADPEIGQLFDAIGTFLAGLPAEDVAAARGLPARILEPPLLRWPRVRDRAAYWRLFDTAIAIDPGVPARGSSWPTRLALRLAGHGPASIGRPLAALLLTAALPVRAIVRRVLPATRSRRQQAAA